MQKGIIEIFSAKETPEIPQLSGIQKTVETPKIFGVHRKIEKIEDSSN